LRPLRRLPLRFGRSDPALRALRDETANVRRPSRRSLRLEPSLRQGQSSGRRRSLHNSRGCRNLLCRVRLCFRDVGRRRKDLREPRLLPTRGIELAGRQLLVVPLEEVTDRGEAGDGGDCDHVKDQLEMWLIELHGSMLDNGSRRANRLVCTIRNRTNRQPALEQPYRDLVRDCVGEKVSAEARARANRRSKC
jgi:hypothetical protein